MAPRRGWRWSALGVGVAVAAGLAWVASSVAETNGFYLLTHRPLWPVADIAFQTARPDTGIVRAALERYAGPRRMQVRSVRMDYGEQGFDTIFDVRGESRIRLQAQTNLPESCPAADDGETLRFSESQYNVLVYILQDHSAAEAQAVVDALKQALAAAGDITVGPVPCPPARPKGKPKVEAPVGLPGGERPPGRR